MLKAVEDWLDIRSGELQRVVLCILGAFFLLAFVILARSIREGLFLAVFNAKKLPYITAVVACLSLPAVGIFAGFLGRLNPWIVMQRLMLITGAGLALSWAVSSFIQATAVVFYIWTILTTMLLTSGFWIMVAESFALRGAKRLFGLVTAGGTAGAMVMGISLSWITLKLRLIQLIPLLIGLLIILYLIESKIYRLSQSRLTRNGESRKTTGNSRNESSSRKDSDKAIAILSIQENFAVLARSPYLGLIAAVVFIATVSSSIVDYQLKEYAQLIIGDGEKLTAFFGAIYGWTGGIALVIQLLFTAKIMASAGVTLGLAVLPGMLLFGSFGFLFVPGLMMAILVRGGDNTLRKSLLRPMLEFLYVPIPASVRRKTKTFIDSYVDSAAEGTGAVLVYVWVVLAGGRSKYLSILVIACSLIMFVLIGRLRKKYLATIVSRLTEEDASIRNNVKTAEQMKMHLITASYSRLDVQSMMIEVGPAGAYKTEKSNELQTSRDAGKPRNKATEAIRAFPDLHSALKSPDDAIVLQALENTKEWNETQIPQLIRLLARGSIHKRAGQSLARIGRPVVPRLVAILGDENADFVIRRRITGVLAGVGGVEAEHALFDALSAGRFEIRYRAGSALVRLRRTGLNMSKEEYESLVWKAIRKEVNYSHPVWEMRRLLDALDSSEDDGLVEKRVGVRCDLSLEHTFRLLTLVLDPEPVAAALHGILLNHEDLKSFALEYLETALPSDITDKLWLLIGDISEFRKAKQARPIQQVVSDLMESRATLFRGEVEREALNRILGKKDS